MTNNCAEREHESTIGCMHEKVVWFLLTPILGVFAAESVAMMQVERKAVSPPTPD